MSIVPRSRKRYLRDDQSLYCSNHQHTYNHWSPADDKFIRLIVVQEKVCVVGRPLYVLVVYVSHGSSATEMAGKDKVR